MLFGQTTSICGNGAYSAYGVDPTTDWTLSFGIFGNAALGFGGGGGTAINLGNSDSNGISWSITGTAQGGAIAGGGTFIGGGVSKTNFDNVNQLNGTSYQFGRAGLNAGPLTFAGEAISGSDYHVHGGTLYGGIGQFYTANSATASTTSALIQYSNGVLSIGNTGSSAIWSLRVR
jgi:hypothetical protein